MIHSLVAIPGGWELVLIVLVILLLFGAKKLPELARGSGRALRIFKAETKGLVDDDDDEQDQADRPAQGQLEPPRTQPQPPVSDPSEPVVRDQGDNRTS
ncbi:Sec-independent protein translocase subunit TatA [Nocardioides sp. GCM10027113]|uniref:Sec-independent protein translocase subunit TatA n=1 Tax=unclassified Nocardioides TaxID=2615069 RepID=UPI00360C6FA0